MVELGVVLGSGGLVDVGRARGAVRLRGFSPALADSPFLLHKIRRITPALVN